MRVRAAHGAGRGHGRRTLVMLAMHSGVSSADPATSLPVETEATPKARQESAAAISASAPLSGGSTAAPPPLPPSAVRSSRPFASASGSFVDMRLVRWF